MEGWFGTKFQTATVYYKSFIDRLALRNKVSAFSSVHLSVHLYLSAIRKLKYCTHSAIVCRYCLPILSYFRRLKYPISHCMYISPSQTVFLDTECRTDLLDSLCKLQQNITALHWVLFWWYLLTLHISCLQALQVKWLILMLAVISSTTPSLLAWYYFWINIIRYITATHQAFTIRKIGFYICHGKRVSSGQCQIHSCSFWTTPSLLAWYYFWINSIRYITATHQAFTIRKIGFYICHGKRVSSVQCQIHSCSFWTLSYSIHVIIHFMYQIKF